MNSKGVLFAVASTLVLFTPAMSMGQMSANPPHVGEKIRELGNQLNPDVIRITRELYASLLAESSKEGVRVTKDEKYGDDERHRLDVYEPEKKPAGLSPVLVCLHGGGFVRGDKGDVANVGIYFARRGILTLTPNYRFAPKNTWPSGAEDLRAVLSWVRRNGEKFGGDMNRVFLMGTSAGTAHVATYVFFEDLQLKGEDGVTGAILFSGPTFDTSRLDPKVDGVYYGGDASKYPSMSVIQNVGGRKIPVFLVVAELDMPSIHYQNRALINALYDRDKALPAVKVVSGHNHISVVGHINTRDESIGPDILEFIKVLPAKGK
jgi:dienelactone hydrolase